MRYAKNIFPPGRRVVAANHQVEIAGGVVVVALDGAVVSVQLGFVVAVDNSVHERFCTRHR